MNHRWHLLTGSPAEFTLEARIFHSISLGIALLTFVYAPYDLFAGMHVAALSALLCSGIFFYEYYRSRFLLRGHRSLLFGIIGLFLFSVNYFANSGIQGSTDLIWPVYLLLLLTICPYRHILTWVIIYILVFGLVHVAEYLYPELVHFPFRAGSGQFTDRITAFPIPAISIAIIIGVLRRNYDKERAIVAQRDAEKSRLLSILSHDLRSPFIQVQHYFELLNDQTLSQKDRDRIEHALKHTNEQTLHLVTNLLYWSRSQLQGVSVQISTLPLTETLNNTLEIAKGLSSDKGIMFTTDIHPGIHVKADADMLQLVLRNLLQNAIKFTASGGTIHVETEKTGKDCLISVYDNGRGIAPERVANLFSGTTSTFGTANEKGIGLGLQLCKEFMELQGGRIKVESEPEKGSRFMVQVPLALL